MGDCACNSGTKIIYSCSGAADVGEIADRAVRALRREGFAQGSCIAAVGAGLSGYVQSAKGADVNIVVDGCPVGCARKIMENIGVTPLSFVVTEMGFVKGNSPATPESIEDVCRNIKEGKLSAQKPVTSGGCGCGCGGK